MSALKGVLMDKKAIKTFAIQARRSLIESIKLKLENLGITRDGVAEKHLSPQTKLSIMATKDFQ